MRRLMLFAAMAPVVLYFAPATATEIYAPGAQYATQEGNANNVVFDPTGDQHVQWFFAPTVFGTGPVSISAVSFRFDSIVTNQDINSGVFTLDSDFRVSLGTVTTAGTSFAGNLGNAVTVMSGARAIPYTVGAPAGQTKPFGVTLTFDRSFTYDPAAGMLVFDMYVPQSGDFGTLDFVTGDSRAFRLFNLDPAAATGTIQSFAPVARFDVTSLAAAVPEPASWGMMLAGFGMAGGALRRRRSVTVAAVRGGRTLATEA